MSKIRLHGSSSGYTEIAPVAASGNNTLTLPNDGTIISQDSNGAVGVTSITVGTGVTAGDGRVTATSFHGSAASLTARPAANIVGLATAGFERTGGFSGGKVLQVVQFTTSSTNNYSSADFQNTVVTVNITPTAADSKFLLKSVIHFGIQNPATAISLNFSDSLHASGTTHPLGSMSGDGTNGASGSRLPAFFGHGSYEDATDVDNYFIGNVYGELLYTPAYQNTNQRAFTVMVRSSFGDLVRLGMNAHYNAANPRDYRPTSSITIMAIES